MLPWPAPSKRRGRQQLPVAIRVLNKTPTSTLSIAVKKHKISIFSCINFKRTRYMFLRRESSLLKGPSWALLVIRWRHSLMETMKSTSSILFSHLVESKLSRVKSGFEAIQKLVCSVLNIGKKFSF